MAVFLKWLSASMTVVNLFCVVIGVYIGSYLMAFVWALLAVMWAINFVSMRNMIKIDKIINDRIEELKQWK